MYIKGSAKTTIQKQAEIGKQKKLFRNNYAEITIENALKKRGK